MTLDTTPYSFPACEDCEHKVDHGGFFDWRSGNAEPPSSECAGERGDCPYNAERAEVGRLIDVLCSALARSFAEASGDDFLLRHGALLDSLDELLIEHVEDQHSDYFDRQYDWPGLRHYVERRAAA